MKMPWIILILVFPILGVSLYLLVGLDGGTKMMSRRYREVDARLFPMLPENRGILNELKEKEPKAGRHCVVSAQLCEVSGLQEYEAHLFR